MYNIYEISLQFSYNSIRILIVLSDSTFRPIIISSWTKTTSPTVCKKFAFTSFSLRRTVEIQYYSRNKNWFPPT